jgi:hypothetical protein
MRLIVIAGALIGFVAGSAHAADNLPPPPPVVPQWLPPPALFFGWAYDLANLFNPPPPPPPVAPPPVVRKY